MSKIKKNFVLENLEVVDISTEGKAIAKNEGLVVFIEGAVPGDVVDVMVHRKKNSFAEGTVHRMIKLSEQRVKPICEHLWYLPAAANGKTWAILLNWNLNRNMYLMPLPALAA